MSNLKELRKQLTDAAVENRGSTNSLLSLRDRYAAITTIETKLQLAGHPIVDSDALGFVHGTSVEMISALQNLDGLKVLDLFNRIVSKTQESKEANVQAIYEKVENDQEYFENLVAENLPSAKYHQGKTGERYVSTYEGGLAQLFKRGLIDWADKGPKGISDDGIGISKDGLMIFNPKTGGEGRDFAPISWQNASKLEYIGNGSNLFRPISDIRLVMGEGFPLETFGGILRITFGAAQQTDTKLPNKVEIPMMYPLEWASGLTKICTAMVDRSEKGPRSNYAPVILLSDFPCLKQLFDGKTLDVLINQQKRKQNSALDEWAKTPLARKRRW